MLEWFLDQDTAIEFPEMSMTQGEPRYKYLSAEGLKKIDFKP